MRGQKGITLVALIITIIVLLILAVVAIAAVTDTGIIGHSQNAQEKYTAEQEKENQMLKNYVTEINKYNSYYPTSTK